MTTNWEELFDRGAATDGTVDLETIRGKLERRRGRGQGGKRERERKPERERREENDA